MKFLQFRIIVGGRRFMPDIGSAFIAGYSGGRSHVDTIVPAGLDWAIEGWLYGARNDRLAGVPRGFQLRPPGYTTFHQCDILTVPVTDQQFSAFWAAHRVKLGKPYDWRSIVSFLVPFGLTRNWREPDSWMCSEGAEDTSEVSEVLSACWLAPSKISPGVFAVRVEVLPRVWSTNIPWGTDPRAEAALALEDWRYHRGTAA
jgi:hypothetical protein